MKKVETHSLTHIYIYIYRQRDRGVCGLGERNNEARACAHVYTHRNVSNYLTKRPGLRHFVEIEFRFCDIWSNEKRFCNTWSNIYIYIYMLLCNLNVTYKPDGLGTCYISFYIMDANGKCTSHANKKKINQPTIRKYTNC